MLFYLFSFAEDIITGHLAYPRCRTAQSAKHAHCSCLTCSIGSKKTENLSAFHLKRNMVDCRKMPKAFSQLIHFNNRNCHILRFLPFQRWRTKNRSKFLKNPFGCINPMHLSMINKSNPVTLTSLIHNRS